MQAMGSWPVTPYDGSRRSLAALKNMTSDLIGRFCGSVQAAMVESYSTDAFVRYNADLVVPRTTSDEIAVLKGVAAHYVMLSDERREVMAVQREIIEELVEALSARPEHLDAAFTADHAAAPDDAARLRVIIDQIASLTDSSALTWHRRLTLDASNGRAR
jgi:dGTPase